MWPERDATPDSILEVERVGAGVVGALTVLDPAGIEVPVARYDWTERLVALAPVAPLAGAVRGWTADALDMPAAGTLSIQHAEGASGGASTTQTTFASCPASAVWAVTFEQTCAAWDPETRDCAPVEDEAGCGCGSSPAGGWLGLVALGLAIGRSRAVGRG